MSVGRQVNWKGQMRVDVPHMRAMESSIVYDFDVLAGLALGGASPYVLKGFYLAAWAAGQNPSTLQLVVADGLIFNYQASENGTMLQVPSDRAAETLAVTNARVEGAWTSGTDNYVAIDFVRTEDSETDDVVQFIDATSLAASPKTIPLGRTLDYRICISTEPFSSNPHLCPVAIVKLDAGGLVDAGGTGVRDARTMYFRLAEGGDSPNPLGVYSWPQGRAVENVTSFSGGDKAITDEKTWKSAIMHRLWEITGGEYWYSNVTDRNIKFSADPGNQHTRLTLTDNVVWAGGLLSWTGLYVFLDGSTGTINTITDDAVGIAMADGDVAYVELNRYSDGAALVVTKTTRALYNLLPPPTRVGSRYILFWAENFGGGTVRVYSRLDYLSIGQYSGAATTAAYGVVKTNTANIPAGGPYAVISDGLSGKAIATGLTRGTLPVGEIEIGGGANDTSIALKKPAIVDGAASVGAYALEGIGGNAAGTIGVYGRSLNANGNGVKGAGSGTGYGVQGVTTGTGAAIEGDASGGSGYGALFKGNATRAALNVFPQNAVPSTPANGDLWYDESGGASATNYRVRSWINGWNKDLTPREKTLTINSTNASNVNWQDLDQWDVTADSTYEIDCLLFMSANAGSGLDINVTHRDGGGVYSAPYDYAVVYEGWAGVNFSSQSLVTAGAGSTVSFATAPANVEAYKIRGTFRPTTTGDVIVRYRANVNGQTVTVYEGSILKLRQVK